MGAAEIIALIGTVIKTAVDLTPTVIKTVQDAEPFAMTIWNNLGFNSVLLADALGDDRGVGEIPVGRGSRGLVPANQPRA